MRRYGSGRSNRECVRFLAAALSGILAAGFAAPSQSAGAEAAAAAPSTRFQATVFEVRLAPERISDLDARALAARAATAADLQAVLGAIGPTKVLVEADQPVNLAEDYVSIQKEESLAIAARMTDSAAPQSTIRSKRTGAVFKISGQAAGGASEGLIQLHLAAEVAAMGKNAEQVARGVNTMLHRQATQSHKGLIETGRPFVMVSTDAASPDENGLAVALITRVVVGDARPEAAKGGGGGAKPQIPPAPGLSSARFQATVYKLRVPAAKAAQVDANTLTTKAATPEDLLKALAELGRVQTMYQVDQAVGLDAGRILVGANVPVVTGTRQMVSGETIRRMQYQSFGAAFTVSVGPAKDAGRKGADVAVSISGAVPTGKQAGAESGRAPPEAARKMELAYNGPAAFGRPFVFAAVDSTAPDSEGNSTVFVCRAVLGEVRP
jgi:hypothetical protein